MELNATFILLDEKEGRHAAQRLGLPVLGTVGVLLAAKDRSLVQQVRPHLDALRQTAGFYLSQTLYTTVLKQAAE